MLTEFGDLQWKEIFLLFLRSLQKKGNQAGTSESLYEFPWDVSEMWSPQSFLSCCSSSHSLNVSHPQTPHLLALGPPFIWIDYFDHHCLQSTTSPYLYSGPVPQGPGSHVRLSSKSPMNLLHVHTQTFASLPPPAQRMVPPPKQSWGSFFPLLLPFHSYRYQLPTDCFDFSQAYACLFFSRSLLLSSPYYSHLDYRNSILIGFPFSGMVFLPDKPVFYTLARSILL